MFPKCRFWDSSLKRGISRWTRPRPGPSLSGPYPLPARSFSGSLVLLTFIDGSSTTTARLQLRSQLSPLPAFPFRWSSEAEKAFCDLKTRFTSAPILIFPDPERQFIVEVDASDTGVGAVLSQRSAKDQKVHPCAFFSRKLSTAERNYDVGNRELLAVKLALEEWRHWLEGSEQPFSLTDLPPDA